MREQGGVRRFLRIAGRAVSAIVVLAVIVVFFLMLFPSGHGYHLAPSTATMSNMKQIAVALQRYAVDNDGRLPAYFSTNEDLRVALASYDLRDGIFDGLNPDGGEIVPNPLLAGVSWSEVAEPENVALLYETVSWSRGRTFFALLDVSVRNASAESVVRLDPDISGEDDPKERRFRVAMTHYRITESVGPNFDVTIDKWDGNRWAVQYEGASIRKPIIRWEPYEVLVYLRQPPNEIVGEAPSQGHYELVVVDKDGVRLKPAEAWTLYQ